MNILIIEDEPLAAERLEELLLKCDPSIKVAGKCDSVKRSVKWLMENPLPDLMFLDIQLGDGVSFEIFDQVDIDCPVIFTTAFDAYAIEAFKLNSIGYLLKPVKPDELKSVIEKYKASPYFIENASTSQQKIDLDQVRQLLTREYKKRFLVKTGLHIRSIPVEEILYFYSLEKATYVVILSHKTLLFDYALEQLEKVLDPAIFFRINRKYIVSFKAISDMVTFSHYKLKIKLQNCSDEDIFISRDRMQDFKEWLDR